MHSDKQRLRSYASPVWRGKCLMALGSMLAYLSFGMPAARADEAFMLTTSRGDAVEVLITKPDTPGPFPVLVLGSGSSYPMRLPVLQSVAEGLQRQGIAVARFNWAYQLRDPQHGKPSADRQQEIEDMATVLAHVQQSTWADKRRVLLGGKSLGSIIAWQLFQQHPEISGAVLLTPVCSSASTDKAVHFETNYPALASEQRRSLWIQGNSDPVCNTGELYRHLASNPLARAVVLSGNHGFEAATPASAGTPVLRSLEKTLALLPDIIAEFTQAGTATAASATLTNGVSNGTP